MSGHSKWSTIKHKKAIEDQKRGKVFTKLGKMITVAAREGGDDLTSNFQLRLAIDKAKQANMPKANIQKAVSRGAGGGGGADLYEAVYEGFGPGKISVMIEVVTDNKNRTASEVKTFVEKNGGSLGQPGSVSFLFDKKGVLLIKKELAVDEQMLKIIDLGVEDVREVSHELLVIVPSKELMEKKQKITELRYEVLSAELAFLAKTELDLEDSVYQKAVKFLGKLTDLDDVSNVYSNLKEKND